MGLSTTLKKSSGSSGGSFGLIRALDEEPWGDDTHLGGWVASPA
jgi:hypothetical protein